MTVYVDNARKPLGRMKMCHMMADTEQELHDMAKRLSMHSDWFQGDHYDLCLANREHAIEMGAQEVSSRFLVQLRKERRK